MTHALKPKPQNNSHINNIYHNGNILKVNLLFQINYGDAFEFVWLRFKCDKNVCTQSFE